MPLTHVDAESGLAFVQSADWRTSAIREMSGQDDVSLITTYQAVMDTSRVVVFYPELKPDARGTPNPISVTVAPFLPRTVLSSGPNSQTPTAVLAQQEM